MFISSVRWGFTNVRSAVPTNFTVNSRYIVVAEQSIEDPLLVKLVFHDDGSIVIRFKTALVAERFIQQISND